MSRVPSYNLYFYKNSDFEFKFKIKDDEGNYANLTSHTVVFTASNIAGGTNVFSYSSSDSPSMISLEDDDTFVITINSEVIDAITQETLFFTIDLINASDFDERYLQGNIYLQKGAD